MELKEIDEAFPVSKIKTRTELTMLITQLPTMISAEDQPKTFVSFWRMVADNRPEFLVQIGNSVERGFPQYPVYYSPGDGAVLGSGDTFVTTLEEELVLDGFVMKRLLKVEIGEETSITVTHYQYIDWNEWDVPRTPFVVVDLLNLVNKSEHPVVVYCSKGSGRSSTFAAIEYFNPSCDAIVKEEADYFDALGLFGLSTEAQLYFIETANALRNETEDFWELLEELQLDMNWWLNKIPLRVKDWLRVDEWLRGLFVGTNMQTVIETTMHHLREMHAGRISFEPRQLPRNPFGPIDDEQADAQNAKSYTEYCQLVRQPPVARERFQRKCRYAKSLNIRSAVRLRDASGKHVWINASDVRVPATGLIFRLTQAPMDGTDGTKDPTIEDFWRMVLTGGSEYIVQLCAMREGTDFVCPSYFPEAGNGQLWGHHWVRTLEKTHILDGDVIRRTIEVKYLDDPEEEGRFHRASAPHIVHHLQYLKYEGEYPDGSIENIVELLDIVNKSTKPVIVMCRDGLDKSAAFVGIECMARLVEIRPLTYPVTALYYISRARYGALTTPEALDVIFIGVYYMLVKSYNAKMDGYLEQRLAYEMRKLKLPPNWIHISDSPHTALLSFIS